MKNEQSRDTRPHQAPDTEQRHTEKNTTQKNKKRRNTAMNSGALEGYAVHASYNLQFFYKEEGNYSNTNPLRRDQKKYNINRTHQNQIRKNMVKLKTYLYVLIGITYCTPSKY